MVETNRDDPAEEVCVLIRCASGAYAFGYLFEEDLVCTRWHLVREHRPGDHLQVTVAGESIPARIERHLPEVDAAVLRLARPARMCPPRVRRQPDKDARWTLPTFPDPDLSGVVVEVAAEGGSDEAVMVLGHARSTWPEGLSGVPIVVHGAVVGHVTEPGPSGFLHFCPALEALRFLSELRKNGDHKVQPPGRPYGNTNYVSRPYEQDQALDIVKRDHILAIAGPTGKKTFVGWLLESLRAENEGTRTIHVDMRRFVNNYGAATWTNDDTLYRWLKQQFPDTGQNFEHAPARLKGGAEDGALPPNKLAAEHLKQFREVLTEAFPSSAALARFYREAFGLNLLAIVADGAVYDMTHNLINKMESEGKTNDLESAAYAACHSNQNLCGYLRERGYSVPAAPAGDVAPTHADQPWALRFESFVKRYLESTKPDPVVVVIDQFTALYETSGLFRGFEDILRTWPLNWETPPWDRLSLVLTVASRAALTAKRLYAYTSSHHVQNTIDLPDFQPWQVMKLVELHRLHWTQEEVRRLMEHVGGHPEMLRLAMYRAYQRPHEHDIADILRDAAGEGGDFGVFEDHLRRLHDSIMADKNLVEAVKMILDGKRALDQYRFRLGVAGVVERASGGFRIRYAIYENYLNDSFGRPRR
jgi:AAA-like domain/Effector-associated domain 1